VAAADAEAVVVDAEEAAADAGDNNPSIEKRL
jgi:hypothetical protein